MWFYKYAMKIKSLDDSLSGILFLIIGSLFLIFSLSYQFGEISEFGPGFYPCLVASLLLINSVLLIIKSIKWI